MTSDLDGGGYPLRVGTHGKCEGGVPELLDMSGNVWEWTDSCGAGPDGGKDTCFIRGGSVANLAMNATGSSAEKHSHDFVLYNVGFRCCSDL